MSGTIGRVEVIKSAQRRRRWSAEEKAAMIQETYAAGMSVLLVVAKMASLAVRGLTPLRSRVQAAAPDEYRCG